MKIDMHVHCLPVSKCARLDAEELPRIFLSKGVEAFVLTNHCYPRHCDPLSDDLQEQARIFINVYHRCKEKGVQLGVKVIFGVEIKLINEPHTPEFLLYGLSEEDFIASYPLYNCTQKELFEFCNEKNVVMVQAHPFRSVQGYEPADMRYLHGIEVFNPHLGGGVDYEASIQLAEENNKIKTSGSDFHDRSDIGIAGLIVPDSIEDQFMLRDYLQNYKAEIFDINGILS